MRVCVDIYMYRYIYEDIYIYTDIYIYILCVCVCIYIVCVCVRLTRGVDTGKQNGACVPTASCTQILKSQGPSTFPRKRHCRQNF